MTSPRTASRLTRILTMIPWVIAHPDASVHEVCQRFGYTEKELISDLDLVFVCGLPGYGPGDLMVAYVEDDRVVVDTADYFADAPRLSPAEALALLAAGMTVLSSGQGSDALVTAIDKLSRCLVPEGDEILTVDVAGEPGQASLLRRAAAEGNVVEITYTTLSRGDTSVRSVEPWSVFTSLGNWYLSAFCRTAGAERVFRLDRVRDVRLTGDRFDPPAEPPPPEVRYSPSEDDVHAVIALRPGARWVAEYYPLDVISDDGEEMRVRFSAYDPAVAAGLLLRLGPLASLEEGDEVGAALSDLRGRVLSRYEKRVA